MRRTALAVSAGAAGSTLAVWLRKRWWRRFASGQETLQAAAAALMRTGDEFLPAVAETVASSLGARLSLIGELVDGQIHTRAVVRDGRPAENFSFALDGTPAGQLVADRYFCCSDRVQERFPGDAHLSAVRARGCVGVALTGGRGEPVGVIVAVTDHAIEHPADAGSLLMMFAGRVGAELERSRAERELRRSEEQLLQAQRVEAIGRLAGGIAHDFNNLLMIMIGYAEILRDRDGPSPEVTELLAAANRATNLTRQLLAFGRRQMLQMQRLDLNRVVTQVQTLLAPVIGANIRLTPVLDPALPAVEADPGQMEQVLVNLALNARDAMPDGGTLRLETRVEQIDQPYYQMPPGRYVCLEVSDTGTGMTTDVQAHIFEPFYTTKGNRGTGLGLSSVYGIIKQTGGYIWCRSEPGVGTRFSIYLNAATGEPVTAPAEQTVADATGSGSVLVVDDEPAVRKVLAHLLRSRGYDVHEAEDAAAALAFLTRQPVDLVVTDVVMPGMSGIQLAEEIRTRWPRLKLLFVSAYAQTIVRPAGSEVARIPVLGKPFTPARIGRVVRELLDGLPPSPQPHAAG